MASHIIAEMENVCKQTDERIHSDCRWQCRVHVRLWVTITSKICMPANSFNVIIAYDVHFGVAYELKLQA